MQVGDGVLFYHSSTDPPGVAGLARVARTGVVDETQFDPEGQYYDPSSSRESPRWDCVDVEYVSTFQSFVPLERLRGDPALADMLVLQRGMRLSVQPITEQEYARIVELAESAWEPPPKPPKPPKPRPPKAPKRPKASKPAGRAKPKQKPQPPKAKPKPKAKPRAKANAKR